MKIETYQFGSNVYLIVSDPMSGKRNRYTTHQISLVGNKTSSVVGRELTLKHSRRIAAELGTKP